MCHVLLALQPRHHAAAARKKIKNFNNSLHFSTQAKLCSRKKKKKSLTVPQANSLCKFNK